jgi:hypothetical protein
MEQVLIAAKGRRLQLLQALEAQIGYADTNHQNTCCTREDVSSDEAEIIDDLEKLSLEVSVNERSALFYIAGYIAKKENMEAVGGIDSDDSEFTRLVSRGRLMYPPAYLFDFCLLCYAFYTRCPKSCRRELVRIFGTIRDSYADFTENENRVSCRLANTIMSGHVKKVNDLQGAHSAVDDRKRQKLNC